MIDSSKQLNALVMAGGTGGHIFPGLAVAEELIKKGWKITWLGSEGGMEEKLVPQDIIDLNLLKISGLRGNGLMGWLKAPFNLTKAVIDALKIIKKTNPVVVIGFGGFASGPGGLAAFIHRTPLVIHEQNAIAGLTNKVLAKFSKKVFQAFPNTFDETFKAETVGNPIREDIRQLHNETKKLIDKDRINLLIVGGSRGALALNKNVPILFKQLIDDKKINIKHQVGRGRELETRNFYKNEGINNFSAIELFEFIDDMAATFRWADIVMCRAGASTVSEVAAVGVCAIFIPFSYAVDDHQTKNAQWLVKNEAAICIQESELMFKKSVQQMNQIMQSPEKISEMGNKAKQIAYLNAAKIVADFCDELQEQAA